MLPPFTDKKSAEGGPWPSTPPAPQVKTVKDFIQDCVAEEISNAITEPIPPLANTRDPAYLRQHEQYHHRLIATLKVGGMKTSEIAKAVGMHVVTVRDILKQPGVKQFVTSEITKSGRDILRDRLAEEVENSIDVILDIRDNSSNSAMVRLKAAESTLDRFFGKPTQMVVDGSREDVPANDEELERQLKRTELEIKRARGYGIGEDPVNDGGVYTEAEEVAAVESAGGGHSVERAKVLPPAQEATRIS